MDFFFIFFFFKAAGLVWGFDSEDTQGKTKPSIQNQTKPDVLCQLRGIKGGKKRTEKKKVFSKLLLLSFYLDLTDTLIQLMCSLASRQHMNTFHKW